MTVSRKAKPVVKVIKCYDNEWAASKMRLSVRGKQLAMRIIGGYDWPHISLPEIMQLRDFCQLAIDEVITRHNAAKRDRPPHDDPTEQELAEQTAAGLKDDQERDD